MKFLYKSKLLFTLLLAFLSFSAYSQTGPGGVGTNTGTAPLQLWLRANAITPAPADGTATNFTDASGHGRTAANSNGVGDGVRGLYQSSIANTFPVVRFNGLNTTAGSQYDDAYSYNARTVFAVYRTSSTTQVNTDLGQIWGDYNPSQVQIALDARTGGNNRGFSFDGAGAARARYGINAANFTGFAANTNTQQWTYNQFEVLSVEFENTQAMTNQRISTLASNFTIDHRFGGDIAEIIVYDRVLNPAERIVVENYLSAKYNVTLTQNDFYSHDAATAQPYFHNVIGVGKTTGTNVHLTSASSLLEINAVSTISNNSYLFAGHNNASSASYTTTNSVTGYERIPRTWRLDRTGTIGTVNFRVDVSQLPGGVGCQLAIFTDGDGDFTTGATVTNLTQVGTSSIYQASVAVNDNEFLTIGQALGSAITLTATPTGISGEVNLNWNNPGLANFQEYRVYGGQTNNPTTLLATITDPTTISTTITGLTNCRLYYFRLVPVTLTDNESPCEGSDTAIPSNGIAPAVMNLTGAAPVTLPSPNGRVTLTFDASGDPEIREIRVYTYRDGDPVPATATLVATTGINASTTSVVVPGLFPSPPATCFRITQVNACGIESPISGEQCASITVPPEDCNNSIDDDEDGSIDDGDIDCNDCVFQITDPGEFQLFQFKVIPVNGNNIGYQTPIFGDVDNDGEREIVVLGDNGIISVLNPRNDGNPDVEYEQSGLLTPDGATSLLTMANVDGDPYIEFFYVLSGANNPLACYQYNYTIPAFELEWRTDDATINPVAARRVANTDRANTNLTDFNEDGIPEVYTGGTIFNAQTGQWLGYVGAGNPDGDPRDTGAPIFQISNAADVLPDAFCTDCAGLELLAGNTVYSVNIATNTITPVAVAPVPLTGGFVDAVMSVADMDNDGDIDAVVSGYGRIYVWDIQTSALLSNVFDLRSYNAGVFINGVEGVGGTSPYSGIPTINDFDNDGRNEFGVTKERGVVMFNDVDTAAINGGNLQPMWTLPTTDNSGTTGLSSFDFLGNGFANLVYRDETKVRVFQGASGDVYFDSDVSGFPACNSGTGMEIPTIGDVNDDGQTEIIASCNGRVIIYQSSNIPWLPSRDLWNQVNYNITNINGDLTIPAVISPQNFETVAPPLNNYMAQRPLSNSTDPFIPSADIVALVDVDDGAIDLGNCPAEVTFTIDIENQGDADVVVQYPITFYSENPQGASWSNLSTFAINDGLAVGEQREYTYSFPLTSDPANVYVVLNDAGTSTPGAPIVLPNTSVAECEYNNNFLGPYTISSCFDPLPVELLRFVGKDESDKVRLDWATASERDNAYFEVQRSQDGEKFVTIDVIQGKTFSNQVTEYQTYDYEDWTGVMYYRLKQVDIDETQTLSNTIVFRRDKDLEIKIYPNPVSSGQNLNIEGLSGEWNAILYDMAGRSIKNWIISFDRQTYTTPFPNLRKGMYIIQLEPLSSNNSEKGRVVEKIVVE
ncbi:T9SS type A sorting domain-containing protein [Bernardetia sp.]|uniref:T9SS type A sorting domain-containing protein n=1 Tax=Bernardetia sp. TaxID=1937974 RepID=UPI0025BA43B6|nr:T9SS type A sorting domain-containing protein [Bernardetia sp.]